MTKAEEACPHDRMETAVEALNISRENTDEGGAWVSEISAAAQFWDESCAFAPIKRMGFSNGPGPSFGGEPWRLRNSGVIGRLAASHSANFVIQDASDRPRFFSVNEPITLEEFKALCAAIIPASDRAPWVTASISKFGRENT
jgi:hypothetical protein